MIQMSKRQNFLPDIELLSAYLDNQLSPHQRAVLEARLRREPGLSSELDSLRNTRQMLRSLPKLRAPRNFTLSAQTYQKGAPARLPAFFGAVSALSSALLILLVIGGLWLGRPSKIASLDKENLTYPAAMEDSPEAEIALLVEQGSTSETEEALSLAAPPSEDTSRIVEPTPEVLTAPSASKLPASTATPAMEEALTLGIQEVTTPTAYPAPLREGEATPLAEGMAAAAEAEESSLEETSPAPWTTALFTGEIALAGVALLSGLAALFLLIRQRR